MKPETVVRLVVLVAALANQALVILGFQALPWSEDEIGRALTAVFTVAASGWAWWKNNSLTKAAVTSDEVLRLIKLGAVNMDEVKKIIRQ